MAGEFSEGLPTPSSSPKEVRLWQGSELVLFSDENNHFLFSREFGQTPKAIILVTGYPEGAGELAHSKKITLKDFFEKADEETSMAQVYTGSIFPGPIRNLPEHLKHALDKAGDSTKIELVVYSAGALSLMALTEKYWQRIDSLTIISPTVGVESIKRTSLRYGVFLIGFFTGFPKASKYLESIAPFINSLRKRGKPINMILGENDELIDNKSVQKLFQEKFPGVPITITINPRGHAATVEEVLTPVN